MGQSNEQNSKKLNDHGLSQSSLKAVLSLLTGVLFGVVVIFLSAVLQIDFKTANSNFLWLVVAAGAGNILCTLFCHLFLGLSETKLRLASLGMTPLLVLLVYKLAALL